MNIATFNLRNILKVSATNSHKKSTQRQEGCFLKNLIS